MDIGILNQRIVQEENSNRGFWQQANQAIASFFGPNQESWPETVENAKTEAAECLEAGTCQENRFCFTCVLVLM